MLLTQVFCISRLGGSILVCWMNGGPWAGCDIARLPNTDADVGWVRDGFCSSR